MTLEVTVEFFNLILELKLNALEKADFTASQKRLTGEPRNQLTHVVLRFARIIVANLLPYTIDLGFS